MIDIKLHWNEISDRLNQFAHWSIVSRTTSAEDEREHVPQMERDMTSIPGMGTWHSRAECMQST